MLRNQQVTFLSDGDEKLRDLVFGLNPNTVVLNGELEDKFQQWYPGLAAVNLCQSL
jgi:hypothetical protein